VIRYTYIMIQKRKDRHVVYLFFLMIVMMIYLLPHSLKERGVG